MRGGLEISSLDFGMRARCRELMGKYKDLPMDLADGTLVAIAESNNIQQVFTLDHKDFSVYRAKNRKSFKLIPSQI